MSQKFKVYKSSAGSGKTYQLSKRYVLLALASPASGGDKNPDYYRHILALTFTKAAAEEMKVRILKFLKDLGKLRSGSPEDLDPGTHELYRQIVKELKHEYPELNLSPGEIGDRAYLTWKRIVHHYSEFSVQTIDSFVNAVSRSFYRDLGLAFNLQISFDRDELVEESVDRFFNELGPESNWSKWIHEFFKYQRQQEKSWRLRWLVMEFARKILPFWNRTSVPDRDFDEFQKLKRSFGEKVKTLENGLKQISNEAQSFLDTRGYRPEHFDLKSNGLGAFFGKVGVKGFEQAPYNVEKYLNGDKDLAHKEAPASIRDSILGDEAEIIRMAEKVNSFLTNNISDFLLAKNAYQIVHQIAIISEVVAKLEEIKAEDELIFLDDLHDLIHEFVLEEPVPYIFEKVGVKFRHVLIDEFQDTSVTQWVNLLPLVSNGLAQGMESLVVGDAKQSIYSWRGGDPELLIGLPELPDGNRNPILEDHILPLRSNLSEELMDRNFRSHKDVVLFNNDFFEWLSSREAELFPKLIGFYEGHQQVPVNMAEGKVELLQMDYQDDFRFEESALALIPELIHGLKEEGFEFYEMSVLVRKNDQARAVLETLLDHDIPAISNESLLLAKDPSICAFVSFVRQLLSPQDGFYRWELIQNMSLATGIDVPDIAKLKPLLKTSHENFWDWFSLQFVKGVKLDLILHESLYTMAERFFRRSGLIEISSHRPFLFSFLDFIFHFSQRGNSGLRDFIENWEEKKSTLAVSMNESSPGVQVMTIHKSKGLEFGAVITPFLNWKTNELSDFMISKKNSQDHAGIAIVNRSLERTDLRQDYLDLKERAFIESINLLYVAFTRARKQLIGIFPGPKQESKPTESLGDIGSIMQQFMSSHKADAQPNSIQGRAFKQLVFGKSVKEENKKTRSEARIELSTSEQLGDKPWIDVRVDESWESRDPSLRRPRDFGIIAHRFLESLHGLRDFDRILKRIDHDRELTPEEKAGLHTAVSRIRGTTELIPFFANDSQVFNEQSLVLSQEFYRPDRVVKSQDKWMVLDYKTGKRNPAHHKQIEQYADLLKESLGLEYDPGKCILYVGADGSLDPVIF